ncbi:lytic transglycosylase domain-containing protein [Undibacterium arcticum]|uniref:Lytic transglycosylase domain-containing protein n=1 Tax=Undibacterium arcticum TaxID=1762892 RepID=A0ABV7EZJ4_9BURK
MRSFVKSMMLLCCLAGLFGAGSARADVYGYIDEQGNGHFSTVKIDERYQIFLRGDQAFDSSKLVGPAAATDAQTTPLMRYLSQHPNLKRFDKILNQAASDFALEPALLKAIMAAESGFDPLAVSPKGAIGLMQVMPATAERYGVQADRKHSIEQKLSDPKTNIRLAARYLRDLQQLFPSKQELMIASYNAGEGAVQKYKNQVPPYPETRNYVRLVSQFYQIYQIRKAPTDQAGASDSPKRIHMTIPGRRNMPSAVSGTQQQ